MKNKSGNSEKRLADAVKKKDLSVFSTEPKTDLEKWIVSVAPSIMQIYGIGRLGITFSGRINKNKEGAGGSLTVFSVRYDNVYKNISISVYDVAQDAWEAGEKDFLLHSIIHEFAHVLTTNLANAALARHVTKKEIINLTEELTESIAMLARDLYELKGNNY